MNRSQHPRNELRVDDVVDDDDDELSAAEARAAEENARLKMTPEFQRNRRIIRETHRQIRQDCEDKLANEGIRHLDCDDITKQLVQLRATSSNVATSREGATQARACASLAKVAQVKISQLSGDAGLKAFNPTVFAKKLAVVLGRQTEFGDVDEDNEDSIALTGWAKIGRQVSHQLNRPPPFSYLGSPRSPHQKGTNSADGKEETDGAAGKSPGIFQSLDQKMCLQANNEMNSEATTAKEVDAVRIAFREMSKEKKSNRISYFELVLDPTDFSRTVQNIFHVSFLIKDGRAGLCFDKDELPQLVRYSEEQREARMRQMDNGEMKTQHCVIDISMPQWKELVELYGIEKPRIRDRNQAA